MQCVETGCHDIPEVDTQPRFAIGLMCLQRPVDLASADAEDAGDLDDIQAPIVTLLDDFKAMRFFLRHGDQKAYSNSERS